MVSPHMSVPIHSALEPAKVPFAHGPCSAKCRERATEWLKKQEDANIQERLAQAQMLMDAEGRTEGESKAEERTRHFWISSWSKV